MGPGLVSERMDHGLWVEGCGKSERPLVLCGEPNSIYRCAHRRIEDRATKKTVKQGVCKKSQDSASLWGETRCEVPGTLSARASLRIVVLQVGVGRCHSHLHKSCPPSQ
jgi:hypothetical protein